MYEMPLISVIVPVYKAEKYLRACMDSILNQSYKNLEVILVNDGSPDSSLQICLEYEKKDSRVKVLDQENGGPSVARNNGINISTGEYIAFVDADDSIHEDMYRIMMDNIMGANAQLAIVGMQYCFDGKTRPVQYLGKEKYVLSQSDMQGMFYENNIVSFSPVNKMYSRKVVGNTRFDTTLKMSEDQKFVFQVLQKADRIIYDPTICYNINYTEGSLSRSTPTKYHLAMLDVNEYIYPYLSNDENRKKARLYNADLCLSFFVVYYENGHFDKEDIERVNQIIKKNWLLILKEGNKNLKIKLLLYSLSPRVLRAILVKKRKHHYL